MYSEILKLSDEVKDNIMICEDGVIYNMKELEHLNKVKCDVELLRLAHMGKLTLGGEVIDAR